MLSTRPVDNAHRTIDSEADLAEGLAWLAGQDKRLASVIETVGEVSLRRRPAGFAGLARIVIGQQVSTASADAIWGRFDAAFPEMNPPLIAAASEAALRAPGLSNAKIRTMRAVAEAVAGGLDLDGLVALPGEEAHRRLTAVKGIGPWTADLYLLFCLGHADIFPAGDLALRIAVAEAFGLDPVPAEKAIAKTAAAWSPWRGAAAHLFWAYYRMKRGRRGVPV